MLHGDLYDMQRRVMEEYPSHYIAYVGNGRYNMLEKRKHLRLEGVHDGRSLFSIVEVADVVFSFDHIPDERVLRKLRETDLWRHPRGAVGWYDDWVRNNKDQREKRQQKQRDEMAYVGSNIHKQLINEMDGLTKSYF